MQVSKHINQQTLHTTALYLAECELHSLKQFPSLLAK